MYEYVTEWLDKTKDNQEFIIKESQRLSKNYNLAILKDDKKIALVKEINPQEILNTRRNPRVELVHKLRESTEIHLDIQTKEVLWIFKKNILKH